MILLQEGNFILLSFCKEGKGGGEKRERGNVFLLFLHFRCLYEINNQEDVGNEA